MNAFARLPLVLASERLRLRVLEARDAPALFDLYSDPDVMRYWNHAAWTCLAQADLAIDNARAEYARGATIHCAIEQRSTGTIIGSCALYDFACHDNSAQLGYLLSPRHWGQGYLSEAMEQFLNFAFRQLRLERLRAQVHPENTASAGLLGKLGFLSQGWTGENWIVAGRTLQTQSYLLLRSGWLGTP